LKRERKPSKEKAEERLAGWEKEKVWMKVPKNENEKVFADSHDEMKKKDGEGTESAEVVCMVKGMGKGEEEEDSSTELEKDGEAKDEGNILKKGNKKKKL
jgi:ribosomal protein L32